MAEALINHSGAPRFRAYSAGSKPSGEVNPLALKTLDLHRIPMPQARSKSWDEFARPGAPQMHLVITVCDSAAGEICPLWPDAPMKAHWGLPDPAAATGSGEQRLAEFEKVFQMLQARITALVGLKQVNLAELQRIHREAR